MGAPLTAQVVQREEVREKLLNTIESASVRYRNRQVTSVYQNLQNTITEESKKRIEQLAKQKHALRLRVAALKKETDAQAKALENLRFNQMALKSKAVDQRESIRDLIWRIEMGNAVRDSGPEMMRTLVNSVNATGLRQMAFTSMQRDAILELRLQLAKKAEKQAENENLTAINLHAAAGKSNADFETLRGELEKLQIDYLNEVSRAANAKTGLLLSQSELKQAKNDIAEIHRQVLRMQSTLARLDEQARRKSERSLIELGIINGKPGEYSEDTTASSEIKQTLTWPVQGRITAGFREASYFRFFGIPHNGIDIAVPQKTAVRSAADGVIFVVREGGATGYTYVLAGHANGIATLYGHLSSVLVAPGQTVRAGQVIGLSGGEPGTPGAGPTTTGQHLHFEVIQRGANINPMSVLP